MRIYRRPRQIFKFKFTQKTVLVSENEEEMRYILDNIRKETVWSSYATEERVTRRLVQAAEENMWEADFATQSPLQHKLFDSIFYGYIKFTKARYRE